MLPPVLATAVSFTSHDEVWWHITQSLEALHSSVLQCGCLHAGVWVGDHLCVVPWHEYTSSVVWDWDVFAGNHLITFVCDLHHQREILSWRIKGLPRKDWPCCLNGKCNMDTIVCVCPCLYQPVWACLRTVPYNVCTVCLLCPIPCSRCGSAQQPDTRRS